MTSKVIYDDSAYQAALSRLKGKSIILGAR